MTSEHHPMTSNGQEQRRRTARWRLWASVASALLVMPHGMALAQSGRDQVPNQTANGSMINLILQMVKQGSVTPANGAVLIQEAMGGSAPQPAPAYQPQPQYAPQQYAPQQYAPAQYAPQQYAPQQYAPQPVAAAQPAPQGKGKGKVLPPVTSILNQPAQPPVQQAAYQPQPAYAPPPQYAPQQQAYANPQQPYTTPQPVFAPQQQAAQSPVYQPAPAYQTPPQQMAQAPVYQPAPSAAPAYQPAPAPVYQPAPQMLAQAPGTPSPLPPAPAPLAPAPAPPEAVQAQAAPLPQPAPAAAPPVIRVSYVPESVRKQITDQVRAEVMEQAKREGWAAPGDASPDWVRRITLSGDLRFRSQSELFAKTNANDLLDYGAFNATANGSDITNVQNLAFLNTTQDRLNRLRIRARLGVNANVSPQVEAALRIATGDDSSPISTDQVLGGGLTKRSVWLDRAYLKLKPTSFTDFTVGRFANPFRTTELMFDEDLNFDGVAAEVRADKWLARGFSLALRGGAFPLDFGSPSFPSTETDKRKYPAKWLFAGQIEAGFQPSEDVRISAAAGLYEFHNIQGRLSAPCPFNGVTDKNQAGNGTTAADPVECSTDGSRAFSPRKGNTLFFIRNLVTPDVNGVALERQYLGLTYKYRVLDLNLSATTKINDDGINATVSGNYIRNLGFKRSDECRYGTAIGPFTNVKVTSGIGNACAGQGVVQSGNMGWLANLAVGHDRPHKWGEWRVQAGYRYLQTDATLDSLTDSDFHLGGTNAKGYTVGASLGLLDGVTLGGRWLSANEISGPPLSVDVLQFDLQAEF